MAWLSPSPGRLTQLKSTGSLSRLGSIFFIINWLNEKCLASTRTNSSGNDRGCDIWASSPQSMQLWKEFEVFLNSLCN